MSKVEDNQKHENVGDIVRRMQNEYNKTGLYKATDLRTVLGDPKKSVGFTSPTYVTGGNIKQRI